MWNRKEITTIICIIRRQKQKSFLWHLHTSFIKRAFYDIRAPPKLAEHQGFILSGQEGTASLGAVDVDSLSMRHN